MFGLSLSRTVIHHGGSASRSLSTGLFRFQKASKFVSPQQFVDNKASEQADHEQFTQSMLAKSFEYDPKCLSDSTVNPVTNRPIPLNVELLKFKPINLPQTHGHQVAQIKFRGYDEDTLIRAGEFVARSAYYFGIATSKLTSLKTEKRLYTVIKSPFAQAKSKENFHRTTFNKVITAYDANPEVIDLWLSYVNKYAFDGVQYKATITTHESLDFSAQLDDLSPQNVSMPQAYTDTSDPIAAKVNELLKSDTFKDLLEKK